MLISLLIILAVGGLAYWVVNRLPITSPTIKQVALVIIVAVTCLALLATATGRHFLPGL